jgi:hypothetical protein
MKEVSEMKKQGLAAYKSKLLEYRQWLTEVLQDLGLQEGVDDINPIGDFDQGDWEIFQVYHAKIEAMAQALGLTKDDQINIIEGFGLPDVEKRALFGAVKQQKLD